MYIFGRIAGNNLEEISVQWSDAALLCDFSKFYFDLKIPKWSLNRGTFVSAMVIYQTKNPFTIPSALFIFFWTLPYDSRLFPE